MKVAAMSLLTTRAHPWLGARAAGPAARVRCAAGAPLTAVAALATLLMGCPAAPVGGAAGPAAGPAAAPAARAPLPAPRAVTITVLGTNDVHGALDRLPLLAGFVAAARAARAADGGAVVLLDGGDMFQGTLESNLSEGADIVRAYNAMGYHAAAVGNHELDFGPVGPAATAATPADDARGALKARAAEATFPLLTANILDRATGAQVSWPNLRASTLITAAGVRIGIIGASTESTPYTTMPANFLGLAMAPAAAAIEAEARALRGQGAQVILVAAHLGGRCKQLHDPNDLSSCERDEEIFRVLEAMPPGTVDVVVAGHTHAAMAHRVNGAAVIESYSSARALGRVDLHVSPEGRVTRSVIHPPRLTCGPIDQPARPVARCEPGEYEGLRVVPDPAVQRIVDEALARGAVQRAERLGVVLDGPVTRAYATESAEGNWFADLMLAARPDAQVAVTNGGGLRADLPAGELTYGQLFEAMPFDNRFAIVQVTGAHLREMVASNLQRGGAILSWGGLTAKARCQGDRLELQIRVAGKPLVDTAPYKLATSDFLASGGDGVIGRLKLPPAAIAMTDELIREAMAAQIRKRKGRIDPAVLWSPSARRLDYPGKRPVQCGATGAGAPEPRGGEGARE
jgi:5'-nucleotidase